MRRYLREAYSFAREMISEWGQDQASQQAAAMAYYTLFALAPLLLIAILVAGLIYGPEAARGQVVSGLQSVVGPDVAGLLQTMINSASQRTSGGILASVIGFAILLFGAAGAFGSLERALNMIWDVQQQGGGGIMGTILNQLLLFGLVVGVGLFLLASLLATTLVAVVVGPLADLVPGSKIILQVTNIVVSYVIITVLFAVIFKVLPNVDITWGDVWVGAAVTAFLFLFGKELLGYYFGIASVGSAYGAAGSLVALLLWIYYSAEIFLAGAEFTAVYARRYGSLAGQQVPAGAQATQQQRQAQPEARPHPATETGTGAARPGWLTVGNLVQRSYIAIGLGVLLSWVLAVFIRPRG